ncbi:dihydroorotase [Aestuariivirga sp.]|uniref:dihydroorotase n=1 Tax=Aestuariivirga sp. TaxID=2650926 RepID=UPI00391CCCAC
MPFHAELILKGGTLVNHDGMALRDVAVSGGRIVGIGSFGRGQGGDIVDCTGLHILPGVVDSQVHLREPGAEHKEDLDTGGRAAVKGGVTAVFEMPNTSPLTTSAETLADKVKRATNRMYCDFAFYMGGTRENAHMLGELELLPGCAGVKVFMGSSTGSLLVDDDEGVARILANIRRRAAFHSEDEDRLNARKHLRVEADPSSHYVWRDAEAARLCTERLIRLAREARKRIHVLHVSTADEFPLLAAARDVATVEVTPNHLVFSSEDYARLGNLLQMNPPMREPRHKEGIWNALQSGLVDVLGSDHAPHTLEEKARPYPGSPSGMPGVQTLVPVMLDCVNRGMLSLERLVDLTSHGPNRIFGMAGKGRIAEGYDADFTIVDLKKQRTITNGWIESRCKWTPHDGRTVTGWPVGTLVRGRTVMWNDEIIGEAQGQPIRFIEAL